MSILGNVAGLAAVQPDWAQTDERAADFIRNKPDFLDTEEELARATALAEAALPRAGGSMEGDLDMNAFRLTGLPDPQTETDAATKRYVDSRHIFGELVLTAAGWTGESDGTYTQRVYVAGITGEDRPHYGLIYSGDLASKLAQKEGWALVDDLDTEADYLVFTCLQEKPSVDLSVQLEFHRSGGGGTSEAADLLTLEEGAQTVVQAEVDGVSYGVTNASVNGEPAGQIYDFTVL